MDAASARVGQGGGGARGDRWMRHPPAPAKAAGEGIFCRKKRGRTFPVGVGALDDPQPCASNQASPRQRECVPERKRS